MPKYTQFAAHQFSCLETAPFCPKTYSRLKFGSDSAARTFGYKLADELFAAHSDKLMANDVVVFASPYNYLPNAATVMTHHFINRLNEHLVFAQGKHVDYSLVHRKVSYTADYGFLSKERRRGLIDNDSFSLNHDFIKGKLLLFVDDVRITGTHEEKLVEILERDKIPNDAMFLYFANYTGMTANIEAELNFAAVKSVDDFVNLTHEPNHHVIIRPIKYILGLPSYELDRIIRQFPAHVIEAMYYGCLAEGYYKVPSFQRNFDILRRTRNNMEKSAVEIAA